MRGIHLRTADEPRCVRCDGLGRLVHSGYYDYSYLGLCRKCWQTENDLQHKARKIFLSAKRKGRFPNAKTLTCVDCGKQAHDWDHRSYLRPLDVVPVCRSCNLKRGPAEFSPLTAQERIEVPECAALTLMADLAPESAA